LIEKYPDGGATMAQRKSGGKQMKKQKIPSLKKEKNITQ
jgi:hypothetical protein